MTTEINIIFTYNPKESEKQQITTFFKKSLIIFILEYMNVIHQDFIIKTLLQNF